MLSKGSGKGPISWNPQAVPQGTSVDGEDKISPLLPRKVGQSVASSHPNGPPNLLLTREKYKDRKELDQGSLLQVLGKRSRFEQPDFYPSRTSRYPSASALPPRAALPARVDYRRRTDLASSAPLVASSKWASSGHGELNNTGLQRKRSPVVFDMNPPNSARLAAIQGNQPGNFSINWDDFPPHTQQQRLQYGQMLQLQAQAQAQARMNPSMLGGVGGIKAIQPVTPRESIEPQDYAKQIFDSVALANAGAAAARGQQITLTIEGESRAASSDVDVEDLDHEEVSYLTHGVRPFQMAPAQSAGLGSRSSDIKQGGGKDRTKIDNNRRLVFGGVQIYTRRHPLYDDLELKRGPALDFPEILGEEHRKSTWTEIGRGYKNHSQRYPLTEVLEECFQQQHKPSASTKKEISRRYSIPIDKINNWFQNRRAKVKQDLRNQMVNFDGLWKRV
ncbi:hypothetical protein BU16DRAFT_559018 [Lophium mytilinum]|uniref:Homeobox domain-containing protein n=1 Tax=Lophium mytilinum TaxID=390894 RepID=A0A6A6R3B5_9PEZI|nr:hypothetical protein BU16DRAFT_559018 [Lophium mytilinum]